MNMHHPDVRPHGVEDLLAARESGFLRRDALKFGVVAFGSAWLQACSRDPIGTSDAPKRASTPLERALAASKANGKPVLVFVEHDDAALGIGRVVGDMLEIGSVEFFAALGLCEVVFATQEQVQRLFTGRVAVDGSGLLDEFEGQRRWVPIALDHSFSTHSEREDANEWKARWNGDAVLGALFSDAQIAAWAARARRALPTAFVSSLEDRLSSGAPIAAADLLRGAAIALDHEKWRELAPQVAAEVSRSLREHPPRGSRWAEEDDCSAPVLTFLASDDEGVRYDLMRRANYEPPALRDERGRPIAAEPVERLLAVCGMAVTTPLSARFLFVYTDEP